MKRLLKCIFVSVFVATLAPFAYAQQQQVTKIIVNGIVVDDKGEPVISAAVTADDATGVITDADGSFSIKVPSDALLKVSCLGYTSAEQWVNGRSTLKFVLSVDNQFLDETVVVGYGTQKKVNLTGAVSAVSGEMITKRPVANTSTMLQGMIPGLRVTSDRGMPGDENVQIRVRGQGTYSSAGSNPLVLINGVEGDLATLDPNIIESISVLKDAASASIYGSRAANGVILVTTKNGSETPGSFSVSYNGNFAVHTPTTMLDLVWDSPTYMKYYNIARINSGSSVYCYTQEQIDAYTNPTDKTEYPSFNWLDWFINPAFVQTHNVRASGNVGGTSYSISLNALDQPGTEQGDTYSRYNASFDLSSKINDYFTIGAYFSGSRGDRQWTSGGDTDALLSTISHAPTHMPYFYVDGVKYYTGKAYPSEESNKNMYSIVENGCFKTTRNTDANFNAWIQINPVKGLTWYSKGAVHYKQEHSKDWGTTAPKEYYYHSHEYSGILNSNDGLTDSMNESTYLNFYSFLKYDLTSRDISVH